MPACVVVTEEAEEDIDLILDFVADHNVFAALSLADRIKYHWELLENSPLMGRLREDLGSGIRATNIGIFAVFYRFDGETVEVLRVVHGARDVKNL